MSMRATSARISAPRSGLSSSKRRRNGSLVRLAFLGLILIAAALAALALHLSTQIKSAGTSVSVSETTTVAGGSGTNYVQTAVVANAAPPASPQVVSETKSDAEVTANNNLPLPYPNGPKTDAKYAKDRVYCMVPFVWTPDFYDVIMKTWGRRCNVINFITDSVVLASGKLQGDDIHHTGKGVQEDVYKHHSEFPEGTFPENVHFVNMTRPWTGCKDAKTGEPKICRHIWEKMWRSWIYVKDHHLDQAEWFCKVDFDTFFFPENLQYYVRDVMNWDPYKEHHYFGHVLYHRARNPPMVAGAAACWSHRTLDEVAEVYRNMPRGYNGHERGKCEDRAEASEEMTTSKCLEQYLNVSAEPMLEDGKREYVTVDPYGNMLTWNRTEQGEWWYWLNKPADRGQMEHCCASRPMGFHKYKQVGPVNSMNQQFYGRPGNIHLRNLKERDSRYVTKVRKAMEIEKYTL